MTARDYTVDLLSPTGDYLLSLNNFIYLRYFGVIGAVGELQLIMGGSDHPYFTVDRRIALYGGYVGNKSLELETHWLIRYLEKVLDANGSEQTIVRAAPAIELLTRRIVAYDSGTSQASKTGPADDVMKEIVRENMGADAPAARRFPNFTVEGNTGSGPIISFDFARENVLSILQKISQATVTTNNPIYFDVVVDETNNGFKFRTYSKLRGIDRINSSGQRLKISPETGTMKTVSRAYNWLDEANFVYAGGTGTGTDRTVSSASKGIAIVQSPYNRRELFTSQFSTSASATLEDTAESKLRELSYKKTFTGELAEVPGVFEYGKQWGLGDRIVAEYDDDSLVAIISKVEILIEKGQITPRATLSNETVD